MYSEIIPHLFVGSMNDAKQFEKDRPEGLIICVLEARPMDESLKAIHIPILEPNENKTMANPRQLDVLGIVLDYILKGDAEVLVHCMAGIERSPLAIAWYIRGLKKISLDEAYRIVEEKHPSTQNRITWAPRQQKVGEAVIG